MLMYICINRKSEWSKLDRHKSLKEHSESLGQAYIGKNPPHQVYGSYEQGWMITYNGFGYYHLWIETQN